MSKENERYIGKVRSSVLQKKDGSGSFQKFSINIDNPFPNNDDGTPNQYHKGCLLWLDAATGKHYHVKQADLAGVSSKDAENGYINSIKLVLDNEWHVKPV